MPRIRRGDPNWINRQAQGTPRGAFAEEQPVRRFDSGDTITFDGQEWVREGNGFYPKWYAESIGYDFEAEGNRESNEANRVPISQGLAKARRESNAEWQDANWNPRARELGFKNWREMRRAALATAQAQGRTEESGGDWWDDGPDGWLEAGLVTPRTTGSGAPTPQQPPPQPPAPTPAPTPPGGQQPGPYAPTPPRPPAPAPSIRPANQLPGGTGSTGRDERAGPYTGGSSDSPPALGGSIPGDTGGGPYSGSQTSTSPAPTPRSPASEQQAQQSGGVVNPGSQLPGRPSGPIVAGSAPGGTAPASPPSPAPAAPAAAPAAQPQPVGSPYTAPTAPAPAPAPPPPPSRPIALPTIFRSIPGLPAPPLKEGQPFFDPFGGKFV